MTLRLHTEPQNLRRELRHSTTATVAGRRGKLARELGGGRVGCTAWHQCPAVQYHQRRPDRRFASLSLSLSLSLSALFLELNCTQSIVISHFLMQRLYPHLLRNHYYYTLAFSNDCFLAM